LAITPAFAFASLNLLNQKRTDSYILLSDWSRNANADAIANRVIKLV